VSCNLFHPVCFDVVDWVAHQAFNNVASPVRAGSLVAGSNVENRSYKQLCFVCFSVVKWYPISSFQVNSHHCK